MPNKILEKVVNEESKRRSVEHFNRLASNRDYKRALDFYNAQAEQLKSEIRGDSRKWYNVVRMSRSGV